MKKHIVVNDLSREFKTYKKKEGLLGSIKSLVKREYKIKQAVSNVNFEINRGEIIGYIGPNGAGKSTTIKMLTGILTPTSGKAKCLGYVPWKERDRYVQNIGVIFGQKGQLFWDLPPIDTYHFLKEMYGVEDDVFKKRLEFLSKTMKIKDFQERPVRDLSLGERMKCEFVAAFLHKPKIVFLDEPTIGLDVVAKEYVRDFIRKINKKESTTIILTTHDMNDVEDLCKRIIIIDRGRKIYDGSIKKIKKRIFKDKEIEVIFDNPIKDLLLPDGCSKIDSSKYKARIRVDLKQESVSGAVSFLLNNYDVRDLNIHEAPIDQVIKKIYEEGI